MNRAKTDRLIGIIIGLSGPFIILFGVQVYQFPDLNFVTFLKAGVDTGTIAPFVKIAALFNLAPFFIFINSKRPLIAQGILLATILWGLVIVYFTLR